MLSDDIRSATLLGSYDGRDEYQVGRTLVWVCFDSSSSRDENTAEAFRQLPSILQAIPDAIETAVASLRGESPNFWRLHDLAGTASDLLSVWGIWVYPSTCHATYHVNENHDFTAPDGAQLPQLDEMHGVYVSRSSDGRMQSSGGAS